MLHKRLRTDPDAEAMIADYRARFSAAPIGVWVDCIDEFMGIGFAGVSGKYCWTEIREDGTGTTADEAETIKFEWRPIRERVIEVRCIERIPAPEGWTEEEIAEDRQWEQVEYDFVVPELVHQPTITDVYRPREGDVPVGADRYSYQFLECLAYRFSGLLRLSEHAPGNDAAVADHPRIVLVDSQLKQKPWWKWW